MPNIVYETDKYGNVKTGDFASFRIAVLSGADVRVSLRTESYDERLTFLSSIILPNEVIGVQPFAKASASFELYVDKSKKPQFTPHKSVLIYSTERKHYILREGFHGEKLRSNGPFQDKYHYYKWLADPFGWVSVSSPLNYYNGDQKLLWKDLIHSGLKTKFSFIWRGAVFVLTNEIVYMRKNGDTINAKTLPLIAPSGDGPINFQNCKYISWYECMVSLSGHVSLWEVDRFVIESPIPSRSMKDRFKRVTSRFKNLYLPRKIKRMVTFQTPVYCYVCKYNLNKALV